MDNRKKNVIYSLILFVAIFAVYTYRKNNDKSMKSAAMEKLNIEGKTMGTTYHITYFDSLNRNFKSSVDSLLVVVNKSINNYDSTSEVSRFNRGQRGFKVSLPYLLPSLEIAKKVHAYSDGAFDPTVMPLVNVWGFGPGKKKSVSEQQIDSIKVFIGYDKVTLSADSVTKTHPQVQLDFGGIGQGYGADVITEFLKTKGVRSMLVELGGEGQAVGINMKSGKPWEIGILDPNSTYENQFFKAYVSLQNKSFTTSGNYFNYYEVDGVKYSHTIDPKTGRPARKSILSASVFASDCATADAWGTALMVMGHEAAIEVLREHPEIDAMLLYSTPGGKVEAYITDGIKPYIKLEEKPQ